MVMKAAVPTLDDIPQALHEHYKEGKDDKGEKVYLLDIDNIEPLPFVKTLRSENAGHRSKLRETEAKYGKLKAFEGMDHAEITAKLDRIDELETAAGGKLDDAAINKIVEGRITSKLSPVERARDQALAQVTALTEQINGFTAKERARLISDSVRSAATGLKVDPNAIEDAIMYAERIMEVDEDGKVVVKDKVGFTPGIDAKTWLTDMQDKKPHWWGPSTGGGARGAGGGGGAGVGSNPWTAENWNVTEQMQLYRKDAARATQMAINAGTKIGGGRPAKKK